MYPVIVALLLSGCAAPKFLSAPTVQYPPFPDQTKKVEDPAKARIYLMRKNGFVGAAVGIGFYGTNPDVATGPLVDMRRMRLIGEVGPGGYLCWEEPPRPFTLEKIEGDTNSVYSINLQAGAVYYLRAYIKSGWVTAKTVIERLDDKDGLALLKKCRPPDDYRNRTADHPTIAATNDNRAAKYIATDGRVIEIGRRSEKDGGWVFDEPHMDHCWITNNFNFNGYDTLYIAPTLSTAKLHGPEEERPRELAEENLVIELKRYFELKDLFPNIVTRESDIKPGAHVLKLEDTIIEYAKGSSAGRAWAGIYGAGLPNLRVKGKMTDGDKTVFTFEIQRSGVSFMAHFGEISDVHVQLEDIRSMSIDLSDFVAAMEGKYQPQN